MGEDQSRETSEDGTEGTDTSPAGEAPTPEKELRAGSTDQRGNPERPWDAPGHIPPVEEKPWDGSDADPFEGIDRSDPFAGRPKSDVPQPEEPIFDSEGTPAPGQPARKGTDDDPFGDPEG